MLTLGRHRRALDVWPGFVDALGSLLLVVVFVILVFIMGHFALSQALSGRERALKQLNVEVSELAKLLSLEEAEAETLRATVQRLQASLGRSESAHNTVIMELQTTRRDAEATRGELATATATIAALRAEIAALTEARTALEGQVAALGGALSTAQRDAAEKGQLSAQAQAQVEVLNHQLRELRAQLTAISKALETSEKTVSEQEMTITDLGQQLNAALAEKVEQLARYRSDFFGRLREALGERPDVLVVGDRFVLQAELLFDTASADLGPAGKEQVQKLVHTLKDLATRIPPDLEWILRIDGHTDRRPIRTERFPSNWELSTARAVAIVTYMVELGIPPDRLAATGFAEFHPMVQGDDVSAYAKNRRIELKLTNR
jgi:chemotaxis protein MotB